MMRTVFFYLVLAVVLSACNSPESMLADYNKRLTRVLDVQPMPYPTINELPVFPRQRELVMLPAEVDLTLVEAWSTRHCTLFSLIGERNAILGKLSQPEIRWDYEARLLAGLQQCIEHAETSNELRLLLLVALELKRGAYWQTAWNATFANADFNALFSLSERTLPRKELDLGSYADGLTQLERVVLQPEQLKLTVFLALVKRNQQYALGGSTLQAIRLSNNELAKATALLQAATESQSLCPNDRPREQLSIAQTVMVMFFVGEVQPWLVEINRAYLAVYPTSSAVLQRFASEHEDAALGAVSAYFDEVETLYQAQQDTVRGHVAAWQALFAACGVQVGLGR